ncbi:MAG: hypothetical protein AAB729_04610 [Patescibacteria group bacterium]
MFIFIFIFSYFKYSRVISLQVYYYVQPLKPATTTLELIPQVLGLTTKLPTHGEGSLILFSSDKTVYLIQDGIKHPFFSATQFLKADYKFKNVVMAWLGDEPLGLGLPMVGDRCAV